MRKIGLFPIPVLIGKLCLHLPNRVLDWECIQHKMRFEPIEEVQVSRSEAYCDRLQNRSIVLYLSATPFSSGFFGTLVSCLMPFFFNQISSSPLVCLSSFGMSELEVKLLAKITLIAFLYRSLLISWYCSSLILLRGKIKLSQRSQRLTRSRASPYFLLLKVGLQGLHMSSCHSPLYSKSLRKVNSWEVESWWLLLWLVRLILVSQNPSIGWRKPGLLKCGS